MREAERSSEKSQKSQTHSLGRTKFCNICPKSKPLAFEELGKTRTSAFPASAQHWQMICK